MVDAPKGNLHPGHPSAANRAALPRLIRLGFLLLVVLFWVILIARNWNDLSIRSWALEPAGAAAALFAFGLYFSGQGVGWVFIARGIGHPVAVKDGLHAWLLSMPARYIPGNVWHIAARVRLASRHGISPEGVVASSTLEQALIVLSAACVGMWWLPAWLGSEWTVPVLASTIACVVCLQPPVVRALLDLASRVLGRPAPAFTLTYRKVLLMMVWYSLVSAVGGLGLVLLTMAAGSSPMTPPYALIGAYCVAYVIGYVSFVTPSGIGVREAALASILSLYFPASLAVTLSLLARLLSTAGEAVAVLLIGLPLSMSWRRK